MTSETQQASAWQPGFYNDGSGTQRWWDGSGWTDRTQGAAAAAPRIPARHPQADSADTIWSAVGKPLTGLGAHKIRLTTDLVYFERGFIGTDAQQVHTWEIQDVDAKQGLMQKSRGVGDITLHTMRHGRQEIVVIEDVPDFRDGVRLINQAAHEAIERRRLSDRTQHVNYSGPGVAPAHPGMTFAPPMAAPTAPAAPAASNPLLDQLTQLGALKSQGLLSDEEFAAAKAKLLGL